MPKKRPSLESVALTALRKACGWNEEELARAVGTSHRMVSHYERDAMPARERLLSFAAAMGYAEEAVDVVLLGLRQAIGSVDSPASPIDPRPAEQLSIRQTAWRVGMFATEAVTHCLESMERSRLVREARDEADRLWQRLVQCSPAERRLLVEKAQEFQVWALAERLCHESGAAAANDADEALELADLDVSVNDRITLAE